jgi:hypothetical protein
VWNARVSKAGNREERDRIRASLQFFRHDTDSVDDPADRRQKFKLVVVLREPDSGNVQISKEYSYAGRLRDGGLIKREGDER